MHFLNVEYSYLPLQPPGIQENPKWTPPRASVTLASPWRPPPNSPRHPHRAESCRHPARRTEPPASPDQGRARREGVEAAKGSLTAAPSSVDGARESLCRVTGRPGAPRRRRGWVFASASNPTRMKATPRGALQMYPSPCSGRPAPRPRKGDGSFWVPNSDGSRLGKGLALPGLPPSVPSNAHV